MGLGHRCSAIPLCKRRKIMKLNLKRFQDKFSASSVLAITIEANRMVIEVIRRKNESSIVTQSHFIPVSREGIIETPEKIGKDLMTLLHDSRIRERQCVVCLPPQWALTSSIDFPQMEVD